MVSFSCEVCNDTVVKKKLDQHVQRCYGAYFTCIDCSITFQGTDYRKHTSCISEAEKYEKGLYKGPKKQQNKEKQNEQQQNKQQKAQVVATTEKQEVSKKEGGNSSKKEAKKKEKNNGSYVLAKYLKSNKQENLYKVVKKLAKENSKETKHVLKDLKLVMNEDGVISLTL